MTQVMTRPAFTPVRCGNRDEHRGAKVFHNGVRAVRECYDWTASAIAESVAAQTDELAAELALERALEDRGYDDARAQDDYEARHGVIGFIEAWHMASPETCPCDDH